MNPELIACPQRARVLVAEHAPLQPERLFGDIFGCA
jgi:hypothetical protein